MQHRSQTGIHAASESDRGACMQYLSLSQTGIHEVSKSDRFAYSTSSRQEDMEPVVSKEKTISTGSLGGGGPVGQRKRKSG